MPNIRILAPNAFDEATLSASPAMVTTLPETYLQDQSRARVARSVGLPSPQYVRGDWAEIQAVNAFVLWRNNLSGAATVRFKLWSAPGQTGTLVYDSGDIVLGDIIPYGEFTYGVDVYGAWLFQDWLVNSVVLWFDQVSAMSFEISIDDPANSDGYVEASRCYIGKYFEPSVNMDRGHAMGWEDETEQFATDGGTLRSDPREPFRVFRFRLSWLSAADRPTFTEVLRKVGKSKDLYLAMFPDDDGTKGRDYSAVVKITAMPKLMGNYAGNFASDEIVFRES